MPLPNSRVIRGGNPPLDFNGIDPSRQRRPPMLHTPCFNQIPPVSPYLSNDLQYNIRQEAKAFDIYKLKPYQTNTGLLNSAAHYVDKGLIENNLYTTMCTQQQNPANIHKQLNSKIGSGKQIMDHDQSITDAPLVENKKVNVFRKKGPRVKPDAVFIKDIDETDHQLLGDNPLHRDENYLFETTHRPTDFSYSYHNDRFSFYDNPELFDVDEFDGDEQDVQPRNIRYDVVGNKPFNYYTGVDEDDETFLGDDPLVVSRNERLTKPHQYSHHQQQPIYDTDEYTTTTHTNSNNRILQDISKNKKNGQRIHSQPEYDSELFTDTTTTNHTLQDIHKNKKFVNQNLNPKNPISYVNIDDVENITKPDERGVARTHKPRDYRDYNRVRDLHDEPLRSNDERFFNYLQDNGNLSHQHLKYMHPSVSAQMYDGIHNDLMDVEDDVKNNFDVHQTNQRLGSRFELSKNKLTNPRLQPDFNPRGIEDGDDVEIDYDSTKLASCKRITGRASIPQPDFEGKACEDIDTDISFPQLTKSVSVYNRIPSLNILRGQQNLRFDFTTDGMGDDIYNKKTGDKRECIRKLTINQRNQNNNAFTIDDVGGGDGDGDEMLQHQGEMLNRRESSVGALRDNKSFSYTPEMTIDSYQRGLGNFSKNLNVQKYSALNSIMRK
jgi:hypothetical protein